MATRSDVYRLSSGGAGLQRRFAAIVTTSTGHDSRANSQAETAINIEFEDFLDEDEARDILREAPGIMVVDKREPGGYTTPVECVGDFATFISRIRQDSTIENGLNLWCVSDNLRKGAALNAVQIAEEMMSKELLPRGGAA